MPEGQRPRGVTPRPRSGAAAETARLPRHRILWEEPLCAQGQGWQLGGATHARGQGQLPGGATRGVVAVQAQESLEELSHIQGQEGRQ